MMSGFLNGRGLSGGGAWRVRIFPALALSTDWPSKLRLHAREVVVRILVTGVSSSGFGQRLDAIAVKALAGRQGFQGQAVVHRRF